VSLSTSHPRAGNFTVRTRELRELIVTGAEVPAVEVRLLRNGPELEHSTVRNVVTHLEFLPEAGIRQARAHPLPFRQFQFCRTIDGASGFHLVRSGVLASTVRPQEGTPWRTPPLPRSS
jgi:hypothetical protein